MAEKLPRSIPRNGLAWENTGHLEEWWEVQQTGWRTMNNGMLVDESLVKER